MKQSAFTLLEVLVVITIIGILSVALLLNTQGIRERQQIALLGDQSVAMLQQARAEVRAGIFDSEAQNALCEGALFETGTVTQWVLAPYSLENAACDWAELDTEDYGVSVGTAVVTQIQVDTVDKDLLYALYSPPYGDLVFYSENGESLDGEADLYFGLSDGSTPLDLVLTASTRTGLASLLLNGSTTDEE